MKSLPLEKAQRCRVGSQQLAKCSPLSLLGAISLFCLIPQGISFTLKSYLAVRETCKPVFSNGDLYCH